METGPEFQALNGFLVAPLPGRRPNVLMTTGGRAQDPRARAVPVLHTVGMRVEQARDLAAARSRPPPRPRPRAAGSRLRGRGPTGIRRPPPARHRPDRPRRGAG